MMYEEEGVHDHARMPVDIDHPHVLMGQEVVEFVEGEYDGRQMEREYTDDGVDELEEGFNEEVLNGVDETTMEYVEEVMDEEGRRLLLRADGQVVFHPDDVVLLDEDGTTMTWKVELLNEDELDDGTGPSTSRGEHHLVMQEALNEVESEPNPLLFDVSAYEVCDTIPSTSRGRRRNATQTGYRAATQSRSRRLKCNPYIPVARFSRLDPTTPEQQHNWRQSERFVRRPSPSLRIHYGGDRRTNPPPPPRPPRETRRPTAKLHTQHNLMSATEGLDAANCNYCHLRFYLPSSALRSRINYGESTSQFLLPNAYFECPICHMESASGPSRTGDYS